MLNPPADLSEDALRTVLAEGWNLAADTLAYEPLGFGSHHWSMTDTTGRRWFVNVDELENRRHSAGEALAAPFSRLHSALSVPRALRDQGYGFAVAAEPGVDGEIVRPLGRHEEYAVSVCSHVAGQSFQWAADGWTSAQVVPAHLGAVIAMLAELHTASEKARAGARVDDFAIPVRDVFEHVLAGKSGREHGPFTTRAARLIADHADLLRPLFARYDDLAALGQAQQSRFVLTHGEPHPGNTMRGPDGYLLIDWDTALIAPPERDLKDFGPEPLARYSALSGIEPDPAMLDLYRLRWDVAEVALYTAQFHAPHTDSANDSASWENLVGTLDRLKATHG
jgi:aminoglycoside phosphotransferase (APT) family kinase protein